MPIRLGASTPSRIYLGSNEIAAAYIGATQVWPEGPVYDPAAMVLTMATTGATEEQRTVRIPFAAHAALNIDIDWGDGNTDVGVNAANPEHVYAAEGVHTYTIQVTGAARVLGNTTVSTRWSTKLRSIIQWGDLGLTSLLSAFRGYTGTSLPLPSDLPSTVTTLDTTFAFCSNLTTAPAVGAWNTTNVTILTSTFYNCSGLTSPPDVSLWNTANVTTLTYIFYNCSSLTSPPDVSGWNTTNVTSLAYTFYNCSSLTSPPDVSLWNTAKVQNMVQAFRNMGSLDIPCDNWSIAGVTTPNSFDAMFFGTTLPTARYDALLTKWEAQAVKPTGASFHGGNSKYTAAPSAAATARASLADPATNNWAITDGGT